MLPFKLVYSDAYHLPIGTHIFPADKYKRAHDRLIADHIASQEDFVSPHPASDNDVLLVHTPLWVEKLKKGLLSTREELELEVPFSHDLAKAFWLMSGGSIIAADLALRDGCAIHMGGGFHHAFADHGEGFCLLNDVAVSIRHMQKNGRIARALVVDCDVHQGNGTATIFGGGEVEPFPRPVWSAAYTAPSKPASIKHSPNRDVFTVSLHQENNYPAWKPASSIDINLPDGATDDEYLHWLNVALESVTERFPDIELLSYVAGADPYVNDQLGGLALTIDGLYRRDCAVFQFARDNGIPVMATFAGGYAENIDDTVHIHTNTVIAARDVFA
jgi:acetoin utilization deacetylase AcuC-like enzyme